MVKIKPFRAYVAHSEYAEEISIPSNHSISVEEGSDYVRRNRISFYKVDRPEFEMSSIVRTKSESQTSDNSHEPKMEQELDTLFEEKKAKKYPSSDKKPKKTNQNPNSDFSKKFDGYEMLMNLKETGKEYREETGDLKQIQMGIETQAKLGKMLNTRDDIKIRNQQSLDKEFGDIQNQRKTSMKTGSGDKIDASNEELEEDLLEKKVDKVEFEKEEFELGRKNLNELIQKQLYRFYEKEKFYLYVMHDKRRMNSPKQVGLICTIHYEEYKNKNIKIHEKTLSKTISRLKKLYCALGAYTGFPILFSEFGDLYQQMHQVVSKSNPILKVGMDQVDHMIYQMPDSLDHKTMEYFQAVQSVYVADGHHRLKAYTSLIDSFYDKSNPNFSLESIFVKDPNRLPVICKNHSKALIEKSVKSKENKAKMENRQLKHDEMTLIIKEEGPNGKHSECKWAGNSRSNGNQLRQRQNCSAEHHLQNKK